VAQPLAGAWLMAVPKGEQFQINSTTMTILLQRRLGLAITMATTEDKEARGSEATLGDEFLEDCEHSTRHHLIVHAWVRAVKAARGGAHTTATTQAPMCSPESTPDLMTMFAGQAGKHQLMDVKCYNTVVTDHARMVRGATQAFGATRAMLLAENLGDHAPTDVVRPRAAGEPPRHAKYEDALADGHDVLVLLAETWGGLSPESMKLLGELAQLRNDGLSLEQGSATWTTGSFTAYYGQLLSIAVQRGVANEIERAI